MDDFSAMAQIYEEGYRGHTDNMSRKNFRGVPPKIDMKHSYMPTGVANAGGADNAYAANSMNAVGLENEESPAARNELDEFCEELRARGHEGVANELALVIQKAFGSSR
jgi:hypothetical protein